MKKLGTKIIGSLMIAILIATIGVVLVSAETDDEGETEDWHLPFHGRENMFGYGPHNNELTDNQQAEINALITNLTEEGASIEEIREAVFAKINEMGLLDEQLDNAIEQTEERLDILKREQDLRDQGYSWEEISEIIQEEYVLEHPVGISHVFGREFYYNYNGSSKEESSIETTVI